MAEYADVLRSARVVCPTRHVLRCTEVSQQTNAKGQLRRVRSIRAMSAVPPLAAMGADIVISRKVPGTDLAQSASSAYRRQPGSRRP